MFMPLLKLYLVLEQNSQVITNRRLKPIKEKNCTFISATKTNLRFYNAQYLPHTDDKLQLHCGANHDALKLPLLKTLTRLPWSQTVIFVSAQHSLMEGRKVQVFQNSLAFFLLSRFLTRPYTKAG